MVGLASEWCARGTGRWIGAHVSVDVVVRESVGRGSVWCMYGTQCTGLVSTQFLVGTSLVVRSAQPRLRRAHSYVVSGRDHRESNKRELHRSLHDVHDFIVQRSSGVSAKRRLGLSRHPRIHLTFPPVCGSLHVPPPTGARPDQRTSFMRMIFGMAFPPPSRVSRKGYMSCGVRKMNWRPTWQSHRSRRVSTACLRYVSSM